MNPTDENCPEGREKRGYIGDVGLLFLASSIGNSGREDKRRKRKELEGFGKVSTEGSKGRSHKNDNASG